MIFCQCKRRDKSGGFLGTEGEAVFTNSFLVLFLGVPCPPIATFGGGTWGCSARGGCEKVVFCCYWKSLPSEISGGSKPGIKCSVKSRRIPN